jgi:hypothetical protein
MEILLAWRCSLPEKHATDFLNGFSENVVVPKRKRTDRTVRSFNVEFEETDREEAIRNVLAFLRRNASKLQQLSELGGESEIDFGVFVGSRASFAPSLTFEPSFLSELARSGVQLRVSAYPSSSE